MAVLPDWRSRGIGSLIISAAIDHARKLSLEPLCLNAQLSARPFYQRFGFCSHGPIFMEAGIEHQAMHLS
jgi:predicted GNAT family N-acyltransferase